MKNERTDLSFNHTKTMKKEDIYTYNHLGHTLELLNVYSESWYKCSVCHVEVYIEYHFKNIMYYPERSYINGVKELEFTCDEMIIKGIIE